MDLILSITMLAAFALIVGAAFLWFTRRAGKQAGLMIVLAIVMLLNVAIWTLPDASGDAPIEKATELGH